MTDNKKVFIGEGFMRTPKPANTQQNGFMATPQTAPSTAPVSAPTASTTPSTSNTTAKK